MLSVFFCVGLLAACSGGGGSSGAGTGNNNIVQSTPCTNANVTNLQVTSVSPSNGASNVSVKTKIFATFNTCVNMSTVNSNSFLITNGGLPIAGSYSFDGATYTVIFTPSSNLAYNSSYAVVISNTVTGTKGETFTGTGWGFFTRAAPDIDPPTTTSDIPAGYYNTAQSVTLSCDDGVTGTGCAATYYTTNGNSPTTSSARYTGPIIITNTTTLKFFSVDVEGNAETVKTLNYVIDTIPPAVTGTDPADLASGIMVTAAVSAVFNEPILATTLTSADFYLDNGVTGDISYDNLTNTATFTPNERLACNTTHTATLTSGVTDLAGNGLASNVSWSFITHSDCSEPVTSASLTGGVFTSAQSVTLTCNDGAGSGCARIVYTTDGSTPAFSPANGTIVAAASAGPLTIADGDTLLRYYAEDNAGNREVERRQQYSVSTTGFTYVATAGGISRGAGTTPASFVSTTPPGNALGFFADPSNGRFYRATETGVYFSEDNGTTWDHIAVTQSGSNLFAVVEDVFAVGSKIYAGTHDGLYVSIDGGATYTKRFPTSGYLYNWVYKVQVAGNKVYVATSDGLLISSDKGYTFSARTAADGLGSNYVYDLQVNGSTIYAATGGGLSISTDNGLTFANKTMSQGLGSNTVHAVVVSGATVYAGTSAGLSISSDSGASFSNRTTAEGMFDNNVTGIYLNGANLFLSTGVGVSISNDSGATFTAHQPASWYTSGVNTNSIYMQGGKLFVGAYPSFYQSADNGVTWEQRGLPDYPVQHMAVAADGTLYFHIENSSGFSSIAISTDKAKTFTIRNIGEVLGSSAYIQNIFVDSNTLYVATTGIAVSSNGGSSFTVLTKTANNISEYGVDAVYAQGSTIYAITSSGFLDKSTNGGTSFTNQLSSLGTNSIAVDSVNVYIAGTSGLDVSNNSWISFTRKTSVDGLPENYLYDVAVDSLGYVYASTLNSGVGVSTDNGASFTAVTTLPANTGDWVSTCGGPLLVGSYSGLYISTDNAASFINKTTANGLASDTVRDACYVP